MPPTKPEPVTLSPETRINLGLLMVLLVSGVGGVAYLSNLNSNVVNLVDTVSGVRIAIDKNTAQIVLDGQERAVQRTLLLGLERRIEALERRIEDTKK